VAKIKIDKNLCKGCKLCIVFCPAKRIKLSKKINEKGIYVAEFTDKEGKCTGCAQCAVICPEAAIEVYK
jgi:2-oxoglutarate ferredoxin oxidoreductase subunit delta